MKFQLTNDDVSAETRREMLTEMHTVSTAFYKGAVKTRVHAFIEFCGLMNEFIKCCETAHATNIDFTQASTHSGRALPLQVYNVKYLAEKLNCIYGPALLQSAKLRSAFISVLFNNEFHLVRSTAEANEVSDV